MKSLSPTFRFLALFFACGFALAAISGCQTHSGEADTEWRSFDGRMVWVPRGMHGFWGIRTERLGRIHPLTPVGERFQTGDLRVSGELLLREDMGSIRSWGRVAEIRNLQAAD